MSTKTRRTRRASSTLAMVAAIATFIAGCADAPDARSTAKPSPLDSIVPSPLSELPDFDAQDAPLEPAPSTPASDPTEAVRRYLSGEVDGDIEQSYAALSRSSRASVGSLAEWADPDFPRPTIVDFVIEPGTPGSSATTSVLVTGNVTLEPRLDQVSGFVPQRADVEWKVVAEDGGWRLDLLDSSLSPVLPDEHGATTAAARWATARQQCRTDAEYEGSLLGSPALGEQLCGLEGELVAGSPTPLAGEMAAQIVAAFGPDAQAWARTVPLSGASQLSVVTAPYGDRWVVVGVAG